MALWNRRAVTSGTPESRTTGSDVEVRDSTQTIDIMSPLNRQHGFGGFSTPREDVSRIGAEQFRKSSVFQRCENLIVDNLAKRKLRIVDADGKPVTNHPLLEVWNKKPNAHQSAHAFHQARLRRKERLGGYQIILDRGASGTGPVRSMTLVTGPINMILTDPSAEAPYRDLIGWQVFVGNKWLFYRPTEILWDRYIDPDDFGQWRQVSPLTAVLENVGLSQQAVRWQSNLLTAGAMPNIIVSIPGADQQQVIAASKALEDSIGRGAETAGRVGVISAPLGADNKPQTPTVTPVSFSTQSMGFLDTLKVADERVAQAMGIPDVLLSGTNSTFANLDAADTQLWSHTLLNKLDSTASEIDRMLLPESYLTAEFDVADVDALKENSDSVFSRWTSVYQADGCTLNEYREKIGQDPLPDGDRLYSQIVADINLSSAQAIAAAGQAGSVTRDSVVITGVRFDPAAQTPQNGPVLAVDAVRISKGIITSAEQMVRSYDEFEADLTIAAKQVAEAMRTHVERNLKSASRRSTVPLEVRFELSKLFNVEAMVQRTKEILGSPIQTMWRAVGRKTANDLGTKFDEHVQGKVTDAAQARLDSSSRSIAETTGKQVGEALQAGLDAGETDEQITARINGVFDKMATTRASTIARSETVTGHNAAAWTTVVEGGDSSGFCRRWTAMGDDKVRASHAAQDQVVTKGIFDPFPNGCMFPGDPNGDPEETINCRCVATYEDVATGEDATPPDSVDTSAADQ